MEGRNYNFEKGDSPNQASPLIFLKPPLIVLTAHFSGYEMYFS